jgi:hypothetical protein
MRLICSSLSQSLSKLVVISSSLHNPLNTTRKTVITFEWTEDLSIGIWCYSLWVGGVLEGEDQGKSKLVVFRGSFRALFVKTTGLGCQM